MSSIKPTQGIETERLEAIIAQSYQMIADALSTLKQETDALLERIKSGNAPLSEIEEEQARLAIQREKIDRLKELTIQHEKLLEERKKMLS